MAFESDFKEFLVHTVSVATYSGVNNDADPAYNSAQNYSAYISNEVRMIRDATGRERASTTMVIVNTTSLITARDQMVLPSGFEPRHPPILKVQRESDEDGLHHTVVYL